MVREMIQCFFDEVDNLFPQMRAALEKGDLAEVGRLGHRMKGTVVYLGAQPAKEAACGWSDSARPAAARRPKRKKPSTTRARVHRVESRTGRASAGGRTKAERLAPVEPAAAVAPIACLSVH